MCYEDSNNKMILQYILHINKSQWSKPSNTCFKKKCSYLMPLSTWLVLFVFASHRIMALDLSVIIAKVSPSLSQSIATQLLKKETTNFH